MDSLNIEVVGPGAWYMLHLIAAYAKTEAQIQAVHEMAKIVSQRFFCLRCRHHFAENLKVYPPPNVNTYNELFTWTVEMHNRVNILNDKPVVSCAEAIEYYKGSNAVCAGDCGAKKSSTLVTSEKLLKVLSSGNTNGSRKMDL